MNDIVFKKKLSKDIYIYLLGLRKRNLRNFFFINIQKKLVCWDHHCREERSCNSNFEIIATKQIIQESAGAAQNYTCSMQA